MKNFINFLPPWVETNIQPAFYDKQSGTCLQQTARMYAKVNQLVRIANEQYAKIEEFIAKFVELKDFVDDYFENLDVQVEINNKLDQMVETGEFQTILDAVITPEFNDFKEGVNQTLNNFEVKLNSVASGAPIPVASTSSMTDTTRIYLLTTSGHWYYYNGSVWTDGGVYQATEIDDNAVTPNKLSSELRKEVGYQYCNEVSPANTSRTYYYPYEFETGKAYKFKLVGAGVQYITSDVITVDSVDDDNTVVEHITKIVNTDSTVEGVFYPTASATKIKIRTYSYLECTVSFEIERLIDSTELSDQTKYDFGVPLDRAVSYPSNTNRNWRYPYKFKSGNKYLVKVTNTQVQYVSSPTLKIGTTNSTSSPITYIDTIDSYNSWQPYDKTFSFEPTTDADYLNIYINNYRAGEFSVHVEKLSNQFISNPVPTVMATPRAYSDDYSSVSEAITAGATAIRVMEGTFTGTIGIRSSILPDIIGLSNEVSVLNRATGQYSTPPIQCAKCNLSNLKITETYAGDEASKSYCLHIDDNAGANTKSIIENCNFEDNKYWCVGIGTYEGQEIIFRNCNFSNCQKCVYMHNGGGNYEGLAKLKFINCTFESIGNAIALQDYNGNGAVEFTFINCNVKAGTGEPITIEYKNYGDGTAHDNTWAHKFSLASNSYGNNISLLNA